MQIVGFMVGIAAFALGAQEGVIISGSSTIRAGALQSTTLGSIQQKGPGLEAPTGGLALLRDAAGKVQEVPCEVRFFPLGGDRGETANWKVGIAGAVLPRSLTVMSGEKVVARLENEGEAAPPGLEIIDARNGQELSLAWILTRPERFSGSSLWVRWSWDEGRTWSSAGRFLVEEGGTGQLDLQPMTDGASAATLLEFWVPQGLQLTRIRHRVAGRFQPQ